MDKMKDSAPGFELSNGLNQNDSPIGYPNLAGKFPASYPKLNPPKRQLVYSTDRQSHSNNPESRRK